MFCVVLCCQDLWHYVKILYDALNCELFPHSLFYCFIPPLNNTGFFFILCQVHCYAVFVYSFLEMRIIELYTIINPQIFWLSTFFKYAVYATVTVSPFTSFKGFIHPYLLTTSITLSTYLYHLFHLLNFCMSTKSAAHISSM